MINPNKILGIHCPQCNSLKTNSRFYEGVGHRWYCTECNWQDIGPRELKEKEQSK